MEEIKLENRAGVSFSSRRGRLLIYHATIKALGNPSYIRFLVNSKEQHLAVQCCEEIDGNNFRVPQWREDEKMQFEISSVTFISILYKMCQWDQSKAYLVYGEPHPKYRLVDFDLKKAREIRPDQFTDPEIQ